MAASMEVKYDLKLKRKNNDTSDAMVNLTQLYGSNNRRRVAATADELQNNILSQNSFSSLTDWNDSNDKELLAASSKQPKAKRPAPLRKVNSYPDLPGSSPCVANSEFRPKLHSKVKQSKPIIVTCSYEVIQRLLVDLSLSPATGKQKLRGNNYKIIPVNKHDKDKLTSRLNQLNIAYHTFSEPEDRHNIFALMNHYRVEPDELLQKLQAEKIPATKVNFIYDHPENPIYSVQFAKNTTSLSDLQYAHSKVEGLKIKWEKFFKRSKPTQCKRCQAWGHAANNCGRKYRCVKCLEQHEPGQCSRKSKVVGQPSCVNCGEIGHPSNSPECESFKKYISKVYKQKREQQPRTFTSTKYNWNGAAPSVPNAPSVPHAPSVPNSNATPFVPAKNFSKDFPSLPKKNFENPSQQSINLQAKNVNVRGGTSSALLPPRNSDSSRQNQNLNLGSENLFGQFSTLQNEFNQIPNMAEALSIYQEFIRQLKANSNNPHRMAQIMFNFNNFNGNV